jgi:hypothetical protein
MQSEKEKYQLEIDQIICKQIGEANYTIIKESGLLHDRDLRNIKIRALFNDMINNKINVEEACARISKLPFFSSGGEKYFLSAGRIRNIAYEEKKKNV